MPIHRKAAATTYCIESRTTEKILDNTNNTCIFGGGDYLYAAILWFVIFIVVLLCNYQLLCLSFS